MIMVGVCVFHVFFFPIVTPWSWIVRVETIFLSASFFCLKHVRGKQKLR